MGGNEIEIIASPISPIIAVFAQQDKSATTGIRMPACAKAGYKNDNGVVGKVMGPHVIPILVYAGIGAIIGMIVK
jgi:hypothetical protein